MRQYECFLAEHSIRDLPECDDIRKRFPKLEWIEDYQTFRKQNMVEEKKCLIFARKRGAWLKPFHCYDSRDYRFLSLDLAEGCLFDCVYCYLQSYLNHGALVLFAGKDSLLRELSNLDSQRYWISTGLLSDSLLAEGQYSMLAEISRSIPPNSLLELRSKCVDIAPLEREEVLREPIVLTWSINPPQVIRKYEYGTASLDERLAAAREAIRLGYRIAFHLDPVFYFDGWKEAYRELFTALATFPRDRCAFLSLGLFRYPPELGNIIRKRFPYNPVLSQEFFPDEDGKYHYFRDIRKEMYQTFHDWFQDWRDVPIFRSMEPDSML
jgi:spore photoproduct lyase